MTNERDAFVVGVRERMEQVEPTLSEEHSRLRTQALGLSYDHDRAHQHMLSVHHRLEFASDAERIGLLLEYADAQEAYRKALDNANTANALEAEQLRKDKGLPGWWERGTIL